MYGAFGYYLAFLLSVCLNQPQYSGDLSITINNQKLQQEEELNVIDAYKLKFGSTQLYGKLDAFLNEMKLPERVFIGTQQMKFNSRSDLDKIIAEAKPPQIIFLKYPGIDMWYADDAEVIPFTIDFRKAKRSVAYEKISFDSTYSLNKFKIQFPKSANSSLKLPTSFFSMSTRETGKDFKHYLLIRKSKSNAGASPMVEFTFQNEKLIYIFFANF